MYVIIIMLLIIYYMSKIFECFNKINWVISLGNSLATIQLRFFGLNIIHTVLFLLTDMLMTTACLHKRDMRL